MEGVLGCRKVEMMAHDNARTPSERILIYDDQCRLCVTAKHGLESLGHEDRLRFVPYHSDEAASRLGRDYKVGRPDAAFLIESDGTIRRGLDAFLPLLPELPGGRLLRALMRVPWVRPLAYLAYRLVARYRYRWFGQINGHAHCSRGEVGR
jgi:predicted DCC family thiol-disulfide oxidoreductase YuxK